MALKDILANGSKYADDMILTLPDGTTATVGEMRSLEAEEKAQLLQRSSVITQAEQVLAERIQAAQQQGILNPPQNRTEHDNRRAAAAEFGLDEADPLLGQVVKEMKRIETESNQQIKAMQAAHTEELKKMAGITATMTKAYLGDRYTAQFSTELAKLPKEVAAKVKLEDVVKFAEANRLMDSVGAYDISAAVDRLTWNDMKEHERKTIQAEATTAAERAGQIAKMKPTGIRTADPKANTGFDPFVKDGDRTRTKSLDEVLAEAAQDDSLWANAIGLPN